MATVTTTTLVDDLDKKSKADITVTIAVDGKRYQVDLSKANYAEYVAPLVKAVQDGRRAKKTAPAKQTALVKRTATRRTTATAFSKLTPTQQRQVRLDLKVPRGRISDDSVAEWKKR